ncbi:MAG: TetR/AcrR family transcriptional regulator [Janthinobacterium lividum]
MGRPSLRSKILESGLRTVHQHGFINAGIREITAAAGVPQGSFTNHFRSKEAFGAAILDRYFEGIQATIAATLGDESRSPVQRLHAYFDAVTARLAEADWHHGCLIGNMSLETAEHSDLLREHLAAMFNGVTEPFTRTILAAQAVGEVRGDFAADEIAAVLMSSWQGAMLWMKVQRTAVSIERFKRVTLAAFLTVPCSADKGTINHALQPE